MTKQIKLIFIAMVLSSLTILSSCSTIERGKKLNGQSLEDAPSQSIAHVNADIFGYYLFNTVPLITGDPNNPFSTKIFVNTVKPETVVSMLTNESKKIGASKTTNIKVEMEETGVMTLWIFWYKDAQASGNAIK